MVNQEFLIIELFQGEIMNFAKCESRFCILSGEQDRKIGLFYLLLYRKA